MITRIYTAGLLIAVVLVFSSFVRAQDSDWNLGVGLRTSFGRLEGDSRDPQISPFITGSLTLYSNSYLVLGATTGYGKFSDNTRKSLATEIIPLEGDLQLNWFPRSKITPFVQIGGGGVFWRGKEDGKTVVLASTGKAQKGLDSFLKVGGGLNLRVNRGWVVEIGAEFRYSQTEAFDQIFSGDEKDGLVSIFAGFRKNIRFKTNDRDGDSIADAYDLAPDIPEDPDGYMDNDGIPDETVGRGVSKVMIGNPSAGHDFTPPIVIHKPVFTAKDNRDLRLKAEVFEDVALQKVAVLYRKMGDESYQVKDMDNVAGSEYVTTLPRSMLKSGNVEYCIVAIDAAVSGIGYAGLPQSPIRIYVRKHEGAWQRIVVATSVAVWSAAGYLIIRKQTN